jgi:prepilin-type N-terminal cleavage/methylation domain-containing protein
MKKKHGFTLLEMLIVIIIISLVGTIGSIIIYNGFKAGFKGRELIEATSQARIALQRMSADIGEIRSNLDLHIDSTSQFTFTTIYGNTITYAQSGNFLQRSIDGIKKNMTDGVTSLSFTYYNANNASTTSANLVRCIKIMATVTKNTNLQTISCPRNLL